MIRSLVAVLVLMVMAGCAAPPPAPSGPKPIGLGISVYFGQGELAKDDALRRRVTDLLVNWRAPVPDGDVDVSLSRLLWAGRLDGTVLAVTAAKLNRGDSYWIVEASGASVEQLVVTADTSYVGGLLGRGRDLVPIRSGCCGPRYLTSGGAFEVVVVGGQRLKVAGNMSERATTRRCQVSALDVPAGGEVASYLDLGAGVAPVTSPVLRDDQAAAVADALKDLDTCRASTDPGGVIRSAAQNGPLNTVTASAPARITVPGTGFGTLTVLRWQLVSGALTTSMVWRPDKGAPAFSAAEAKRPLHVFPAGRTSVLVWDPQDGELNLPSGTRPTASGEGFAVLPQNTKARVSLVKDDKTVESRDVS
ncbi:hypothetical protein [Allokutzneria oryzae]|uniref:Lipoprotein n=1 Tax=Allokutzneria oryzae TaxID=1378989 RepID=A0ABV5ZX15_9PSEU